MKPFKLKPHEPRFIERLRAFYDQYSEIYNNSKNKLSSFSELSIIRSGVSAIWELQMKDLKTQKKYALNQIRYALTVKNNKGKELTFEEIMEIAEGLEFPELETAIDRFIYDDFEFNNMKEQWDLIISEAVKIVDLKGNEIFFTVLENTFKEFLKLQSITPNIYALEWAMNKILINEYPSKIAYLDEISEEEIAKISKVGRPLTKELPQSEIENFVRKKLFPNGEKTNDKKFIHTTGTYKGKPNWNQLALKYFKENPEVELNDIITMRQLKERIKKAYEEFITSLK